MVNDEIISIKNPIEEAKVDRCGKHQDYLETVQYLSHGKEGGRGWENFGNVSIKFTDPP